MVMLKTLLKPGQMEPARRASRKPAQAVKPTGKELFFGDHELIVSKTDPKGRITYANEVFQRLAGFSEAELLGAPHSIVRHPDMPRCVFKLLWDTLIAGREIFAYVVNLSRHGEHYWVFAHVTPSVDSQGQTVGYHSNRRVPDRRVLDEIITPLYAELAAAENAQSDRKAGLARSTAMLEDLLEKKGMQYDELVLSL
jgi:PAS domain S-box-containing protein